MVGAIVDGLLNVVLFQIGSDRLNLDEEPDLIVDLNRQIDIGAADRELCGDLDVFPVAEKIGEEIGNYNNRVGLADVPIARFGQDALVPLQAGKDSVGSSLRHGHD